MVKVPKQMNDDILKTLLTQHVGHFNTPMVPPVVEPLPETFRQILAARLKEKQS